MLGYLYDLDEGIPMKLAPLGLLVACSLIGSPVWAGFKEDGNLYGAAESCNLSTRGIPYSNSREFQNARQEAMRSRQDCPQVQRTLSQLVIGGGGSLAEDGNLYGAAEACNFSTSGLLYSNNPTFQNARQQAQQARQNCGDVQNTIRQVASYDYGGKKYGYANGSLSEEGNLYGAVEACGFSTSGLSFSNNEVFQNARNAAQNSRQNCGQVQVTLNQINKGGIRTFDVGKGIPDGNLFGAAEACGFSTQGLPISSSASFETARQKAQQSRQNCGEVQRTLESLKR